PVQINLTGNEHEVLRDLGDEIVRAIEDIDGVYNPESGATLGVPQLKLEIDKEKAAHYGLSTDTIQSQIEMNFIGQVVTVYKEEAHNQIADLEDMKVQTEEGASIPLTEVADFVEEQGPVTLVRQNQHAQMSVTSEIDDRALSSVVNDIEKKLDTMEFPEGYS